MLSTEKCEVTVSPSIPPTLSSIQVGELNFPVTNSARCLGAWWTPSLSCSKWIETNIKRARGAFFSRGSGVFHDTLNPLSSRSIIECCVFPCLLSSAEAWILNDTLIRQLESFKAELAKRILRLPRRTSNNVTRMALQWPSMRARILIIKLSFLLRVSRDNRSLSSRVFHSLATSEVESLIIVRQCRFLESPLQSNFTSSVLASPKHISITSMKKEITKLDHSLLLSNATLHPSQHYIQEIAANPEGSWPKIWDSALEKGVFGTSCTLALLRFLSLHTYSGICQLCSQYWN